MKTRMSIPASVDPTPIPTAAVVLRPPVASSKLTAVVGEAAASDVSVMLLPLATVLSSCAVKVPVKSPVVGMVRWFVGSIPAYDVDNDTGACEGGGKLCCPGSVNSPVLGAAIVGDMISVMDTIATLTNLMRNFWISGTVSCESSASLILNT